MAPGRAGDSTTHRFARDCGDVLGCRSATAADDADAVALDEFRRAPRTAPGSRERSSPRPPLQRQASDSDAGHGHREESPGSGSRCACPRAGRAVQPDHVDRARPGSSGRTRIRAEQHLAAIWQQQHPGMNRERPPRGFESRSRAEDDGLDLEESSRRSIQVGAAAVGPAPARRRRRRARRTDLAERGSSEAGRSRSDRSSRPRNDLARRRARGSAAPIDLQRVLGETHSPS